VKSIPASGIGCRIIREFDDDASTFAQAEPEFVRVEALSAKFLAGPPSPTTPAFLPPTPKALAAAKKFWVKIIRRFTESVPAMKGRLRVRDSGAPNRGRIDVAYGRYPATVGNHRSGHELDVSDKLCLTLFHDEEPTGRAGDKGHWVREVSIPIPWTEIVNIQFAIMRPGARHRKAGKTA
jgi:hypothetical protein